MQKKLAFAKGQSRAHQKAKRHAKLLFIMRVSIFCSALLFSLQVLAFRVSKAQNIDNTPVKFGAQNESLKNALRQLQDESGFTFFYPTEKVALFNGITIDEKTRSVESTIELLLAKTDLGFKQQNNNIIIFEKLQVTGTAVAPPTVISGTVVDESNHPMPGVSIKVKDGKQGWVTDARGRFTAVVLNDDAVLQIAFIGYVKQELSVSSLKSTVMIILKEDISKLDEVQVIGYGTTTKRENTGDVTTISAKTIEQYPTTNALDALQGNVPGLNIYKNTGNPNGTYKVQIRGINGLNGGNPLYVVDGIPYQGGSFVSQNTTLGSSNTANGTGAAAGYDAMSFINPADIESISVLKDADATAIYGSRGADGVFLITTKKGKYGTAKIDASVYTGITQVGHMQPMLNEQQYLQMRHQAKANDHAAISSTDYDINGTWDTTRNVNWQKQLIGGYGHLDNAQVGISGGSELLQYRISGGYNRTTNLEQLGGSDQSGNVHISLISSTADKKFTVSFTGGYLYDVSTLPPADLTFYINQAPDAPALYNSNGTLNFQNNTFSNPLLAKNFINRSPSNNLLSSVALSYKPINGLEVKLTTGYNRQELNEFLGSPTTVNAPYLAGGAASSNFTYDNQYSWSVEPQVNYEKILGSGKFSATVGTSLQSQGVSSTELQASGYSSDLLISSLTAGTTITSVAPYSYAPTKFSSIFGRLSYSWNKKYYIDLTARDDGSSNFGPNNQFHIFSAAGANWIFSEEKFVKDNLPFLSFGKLRGSYGSTGRNNISPYSYLSTYNSNGLTYQGTAGIIPSRLPNPDLSWETTKKAELALDLQFLKGRINFETNFYRNRTSGSLTGDPISAVTGFQSFTENMPDIVQNQGFDATLTTTNIAGSNFNWSTTFLFTRERNALVSYPNLATSGYATQYIIGQPVNITKTYRFAGVNPQTGIYQFYTASGAITSSSGNADKTAAINTNPDFYGSLQNSFKYKQFTLSFLFRFVKQTGRNAFYNIGIIPPGFGNNINFNTLVLNRWQKPGDLTNIQRYGTGNFSLYIAQNNALQSNAGYGDASYIRLQNLSLAYQLPQVFTNKLGIQSLQLFVQGDNLWTITGYNGIDPENQSSHVLPPLRIISTGLRLTL
jgi:TonB-linked SusC/RagA family outer membrane protein